MLTIHRSGSAPHHTIIAVPREAGGWNTTLETVTELPNWFEIAAHSMTLYASIFDLEDALATWEQILSEHGVADPSFTILFYADHRVSERVVRDCSQGTLNFEEAC